MFRDEGSAGNGVMPDQGDWGGSQRWFEHALKKVEESVDGMRAQIRQLDVDQGENHEHLREMFQDAERDRVRELTKFREDMSKDIGRINVELATQKVKVAFIGIIASIVTSAVVTGVVELMLSHVVVKP